MLEILSNEEIMSEYPLKKIIRYNHRTRIQDESVAEHTCFVSIFCLRIMAQLNLDHERERQVLILSTLHDTCESRTSDIPHDVKARYQSVQTALESVEQDYYHEEWEKYFNDVYKPDKVVHDILKLADAYSVYQWCLNEKNLGNNYKYLKDILRDAEQRIKMYTSEINYLLLLDNYKETDKDE